jgi:hypothetical protein
VAPLTAPPRFEATLNAFQRVRRRSKVGSFDFRIGGHPVHLCVTGSRLAEHLIRPFVHLQAPPQEGVSLTIELWDGADAGIPAPPPAQVDVAEKTWRIGDFRVSSYGQGRFIEYERSDSLTWLDRQAGRIIGWRRGAEPLPMDERSKPLSLILAIWCYDQGIHIVHAGLVARNGRGVLIGGEGGSGKTTTSLACLLAGYSYLGDDFAGLAEQADGSFLGHSLYGSARVERAHFDRFPELGPFAVGGVPPGEKELVLLPKAFSGRMENAATIEAVMLPRRTEHSQSTLREASKVEALLRLAPTSVKMPMGTGAAGFERLGRLVRRVPCYWLDMGREVAGIPAAVDEALESAGGAVEGMLASRV